MTCAHLIVCEDGMQSEGAWAVHFDAFACIVVRDGFNLLLCFRLSERICLIVYECVFVSSVDKSLSYLLVVW
jgi:hypothetical protein